MLLKSSLSSGNLIRAINTYAVPVLTYTFGIVRWTQTDLDDLERNIRTMLTANKMLHPNSAIERQSLPRNVGGRGITNLAELHARQINNIKKYFMRRKDESRLHDIIVKTDKAYTAANLSCIGECKARGRTTTDRLEQ